MKRTGTRLLARLCAAALVFSMLPFPALAQDFYGEGNVLIAVDMGPYAENEEVFYSEGTLGTLQWGGDAPTGVSTRAEFNAHSYTVPDDITLPRAPDYAVETVYTVGQKVFFPYLYEGEEMWFSADALPPEVLDSDGAPRFLIYRDRAKTENGEWQYLLPSWESDDGEVYPAPAFLEIECVATTAYSTVWQYTGASYASWPDFDPDVFMGAVELTEEEIRYFTDICDETYTAQEQIYGDPRWEDMRGDRDGKAAYVALDLSVVSPDIVAFYWHYYTDWDGFDCLVMGTNMLPGRRAADYSWQTAENLFTGVLIHELNHYIVNGCIGHADDNWNMWVGEAFAQSAIYAVRPESTAYLEYRHYLTDKSMRLRMIPGMLWNYDFDSEYPIFNLMAYTLGPFFLRYIEREATGQADGRLWTSFFAEQTPEGSITGLALDSYLTETTGEGLDAWMARFMAAAVIGADSGPYCMGEASVMAEYRVDPFIFFRSGEEYGSGLSFDGAADDTVLEYFLDLYELFGAAGGGATYVWRNDAGGPIAVTGAEDRWWFFAADMDIPAEREVIDIASAEDLAKIGHDPAYPLSGRYRLTADIDLGGKDHPWTTIGTLTDSFTGEFDGNGHTVRGLYINAPGEDNKGLFGLVGGNAEIRDLTVYGSVTGREGVGGLVSYLNGGTIRGCKSLVTVTGERTTGGITGYFWRGTVDDCTVAGTVTGTEYTGSIAGYCGEGLITRCRSSAAITGVSHCGGIAGCGYICTVSDCYQTGSVTGAERVGGILGTATESLVSNCYNAGTVSGEDHSGGVVGRAADAAAENCYSYQPGLPAVGSIYADEDGETATVTGCFARSEAAAGEGFLTAAQFAEQSSFAGWDFEAVWSLENGVRPVLRSNPETVGGAGFSDAAKSDWFYDAVQFVAQKGWFLGTGEGRFSPAAPMTRGMFLTVVARMAGEVIEGDNWQEAAVAWAVEHGVSDGSSPDAPITREQLVTMLWRFFGEPAGSAEASGFTDAGELSDWAAVAMAWAVGVGLVQGRGDGVLAPGGQASRAEVAQVLMIFAETVNG